MTHPLTPREKVEPFERYPALASWIAKMASVGSGLSLGEWMTFVGALNAAIVQAEQRTALASGSGDHAELARLTVVATDAASLGDGLQEAALTRFQAHANPAAVLAIIAEVAALRSSLTKANDGFEKYERKFYLEQDAREEAERKLAEAVGLLRDWMGAWFVDADSRGENAIADDTRKFLSKEAERG